MTLICYFINDSTESSQNVSSLYRTRSAEGKESEGSTYCNARFVFDALSVKVVEILFARAPTP